MTEPVVHRAPDTTSGVMPCCGLPPGERMADRMTTDPALVTCGRPRTIELRLLPPGQLLVATIPGNWDEASVDQAADTLDHARAVLGMPDGACVVLTGGIGLATLTDEQLAGIGLMRASAGADDRARLRNLEGVLLDLDRCHHGRHEGDCCNQCGGVSKGNPVMRQADDNVYDDALRLQPLRTLGFDISGNPIVVPERGHTHDPDAWRTR